MNLQHVIERAARRGFVLHAAPDGRLHVTRLGVPVAPAELEDRLRPFQARRAAEVIDIRVRRALGPKGTPA